MSDKVSRRMGWHCISEGISGYEVGCDNIPSGGDIAKFINAIGEALDASDEGMCDADVLVRVRAAFSELEHDQHASTLR